MGAVTDPAATAPPTRLVLIRHGESRSTVDRVVGGHRGCGGLTDRGVRQAKALRDRLDRTGELAGVAAVLTSVLPRAIETAEIIAPALGGLTVEQRCELCEIHPGEGDGLTWEEFSALYRPEGLASGNPYRAMAPEGESWAGFSVRVGEALLRAAGDHAGETVVVVCHGGHGTLMRALTTGCPVVVWPAGGDMAENAARVDWAGVGVRLPRRWCSARGVRLAVARALGSPRLRTRARGVAAWAAAHDARARAVAELERWAGG